MKNSTKVEKYPCDRCGEDTEYDEDDERTIMSNEVLCRKCEKG